MAANTYRSTQFDFNLQTRTLSQDASSLGIKPGHVFEAIYNDACDQGVYVRSERTGKVAPFVLHEEKRGRGGDIVAWEFHATRPHASMYHDAGTIAPFSSYKDMKVVIFNT